MRAWAGSILLASASVAAAPGPDPGGVEGDRPFTFSMAFDGPDRLGGEWFFEEAASTFGCTMTSKGRGSWAAVPAR